MSEAQFFSLAPSYDPGYLEISAGSRESLENRMGVEGKYQLLRELLGKDIKGSLLDIGCGMGGFLLAGKRLGLEVTGVEPSASHSKAAVDIFQLDVTCRYFASEDFDQKFDVIVLSHVIEHIYNPHAFLSDVVKVLRPGGRLILITPNCESLAARLCGKYWSMYKPIDHVTMLGNKSIQRIVPESTVMEYLKTSEWPGEFAAHLVSAAKTFLKPAIANTGAGSTNGPTRQTNLGPMTRFLLGLVSYPFYLLGASFDRQSCLYAVIRSDSAT